MYVRVCSSDVFPLINALNHFVKKREFEDKDIRESYATCLHKPLTRLTWLIQVLVQSEQLGVMLKTCGMAFQGGNNINSKYN